MGRSLKLEEHEVYKVAMEIGGIVWALLINGNIFPKKH
jgi:hypothetical protein